MRHLKKGRKLNRNGAHRKALLQNLATALFEHEKIETTKAKALELRGYAEMLITTAKQGDLSARRRAYESIRDQEILKKLFNDIAPRFADRAGGFTSVVGSRIRVGDNAPMAIIRLVDGPVVSAEASSAS